MVKRILRLARSVALGLVGLIGAYFATALLAVWLPSGAEAVDPRLRTETIYITSNGVHADIVMPVANERMDWREIVPKAVFPGGFDDAGLVGFGWGSSQFYLNAPTWADLTALTAVKAMAWDETYYHVSVYPALPIEVQAALHLTPQQMARLEHYIIDRFVLDAEGRPVLAARGYHGNDAFFHAQGRYWPLVTCNQWTSRALREAGQQVSIWAPFAESILWSLKPDTGG